MGSVSQNSVCLKHLTQPTVKGSYSLEISDKYYFMPPEGLYSQEKKSCLLMQGEL